MIRAINHYNLRSEFKMMEILKNFYIEVVGLEMGTRPPFKSNGFWLVLNFLSQQYSYFCNPLNLFMLPAKQGLYDPEK